MLNEPRCSPQNENELEASLFVFEAHNRIRRTTILLLSIKMKRSSESINSFP